MGVARLCAAVLFAGGLAAPAQGDGGGEPTIRDHCANAVELRLRPLADLADAEALEALRDELVEAAIENVKGLEGPDDLRAHSRAVSGMAAFWRRHGDVVDATVESALGADGLRRWKEQGREHTNALTAASSALLTTHLAMELRLREPQVQRLRGVVTRWVVRFGGDVPALEAFLATKRGSEITTLRQREILLRMRSNGRPPLLKLDDPGDDLARGRGRYPEDEFELEFEALCAFHGVDPAEHRLLQSAAIRCGRLVRRTAGRPSRIGSTAVFRSVCEPMNTRLWRDIVRREFGNAADPGPAAADEKALAAARARRLLELLDARVSLTPAQAEAITEPLEVYAGRQLSLRPQNCLALEASGIWKELRMDGTGDPRRSSGSRRTLITSLAKILDDQQRMELGL